MLVSFTSPRLFGATFIASGLVQTACWVFILWMFYGDIWTALQGYFLLGAWGKVACVFIGGLCVMGVYTTALHVREGLFLFDMPFFEFWKMQFRHPTGWWSCFVSLIIIPTCLITFVVAICVDSSGPRLAQGLFLLLLSLLGHASILPHMKFSREDFDKTEVVATFL